MAQPVLTDLDMQSQARVVNLPAPTDPNHAATKAYVDANSGGAPSWGNINGNLADQADLIAALDDKLATADLPSVLGTTVLQAGDGIQIDHTPTTVTIIALGATAVIGRNYALSNLLVQGK